MLFLSKETLHNLGWTLHLCSLSKASLPLRGCAVNGLGPSVSSSVVVSFGVLFWIGFFSVRTKLMKNVSSSSSCGFTEVFKI